MTPLLTLTLELEECFGEYDLHCDGKVVSLYSVEYKMEANSGSVAGGEVSVNDDRDALLRGQWQLAGKRTSICDLK